MPPGLCLSPKLPLTPLPATTGTEEVFWEAEDGIGMEQDENTFTGTPTPSQPMSLLHRNMIQHQSSVIGVVLTVKKPQ